MLAPGSEKRRVSYVACQFGGTVAFRQRPAGCEERMRLASRDQPVRESEEPRCQYKIAEYLINENDSIILEHCMNRESSAPMATSSAARPTYKWRGCCICLFLIFSNFAPPHDTFRPLLST